MIKETTYTIVACGQSAKDWVPRGYSIGCNDSWKWGKPTDYLFLANMPHTFKGERLNVIKESKPSKVFVYIKTPGWDEIFPGYTKISMARWYGTYHKDQIYYSDTSPFVAACIAASLGAKDIILWGVDFVDHHIYNDGNPQTRKEVERYMELFRELKGNGINVWLGCKGGAFNDRLMVYEWYK